MNSERVTVKKTIQDYVTFHEVKHESPLAVQHYFYIWFFNNIADL